MEDGGTSYRPCSAEANSLGIRGHKGRKAYRYI